MRSHCITVHTTKVKMRMMKTSCKDKNEELGEREEDLLHSLHHQYWLHQDISTETGKSRASSRVTQSFQTTGSGSAGKDAQVIHIDALNLRTLHGAGTFSCYQFPLFVVP